MLTDNLLAWWGLHDDALNNRQDASGNGKLLTLVGAVGSEPGLIGHAASFPGSGINNLEFNGQVITAAPFSLSCFVLAKSVPTNMVPIGQATLLANRQGFLVATNGSINFSCGTGSNGTLISPTGIFTAGLWHHLALTYDGTTLQGYYDGVLIMKGLKTAILGTTVTVGAASFAGSLPWNGLITLAGMWGRALDDGHVPLNKPAGGEIAALYNRGWGLDYPF